MLALDKLCYQSKLRYENAGVKFSFSAATLILCAASRSVSVACTALTAASLLTVWKSGVALSRYLRLLSVPFAFLAVSTAAIAVEIRAVPLDLFAIPLGELCLTGSREAALHAARLALTAMASVSCLTFLSCTTPVTDLLGVLRRLHCPALLLELMLLIYRFIFLLLDTASAITVSQNCRLGDKNYRTAVRSFGMMGAALMIRAVKRSGRLYQAMEARCCTDAIRVLPEDRPPRPGAVLAVVLFDGALLLLAIGERCG